ncbi:hypothetical protein EKK58_06475 [Candidatus Dependentiae bacterium]|nr:MAG: hypothetical protein EKK58_06475 [Candidatus Dependentiae bacterium]
MKQFFYKKNSVFLIILIFNFVKLDFCSFNLLPSNVLLQLQLFENKQYAFFVSYIILLIGYSCCKYQIKKLSNTFVDRNTVVVQSTQDVITSCDGNHLYIEADVMVAPASCIRLNYIEALSKDLLSIIFLFLINDDLDVKPNCQYFDDYLITRSVSNYENIFFVNKNFCQYIVYVTQSYNLLPGLFPTVNCLTKNFTQRFPIYVKSYLPNAVNRIMAMIQFYKRRINDLEAPIQRFFDNIKNSNMNETHIFLQSRSLIYEYTTDETRTFCGYQMEPFFSYQIFIPRLIALYKLYNEQSDVYTKYVTIPLLERILYATCMDSILGLQLLMLLEMYMHRREDLISINYNDCLSSTTVEELLKTTWNFHIDFISARYQLDKENSILKDLNNHFNKTMNDMEYVFLKNISISSRIGHIIKNLSIEKYLDLTDYNYDLILFFHTIDLYVKTQASDYFKFKGFFCENSILTLPLFSFIKKTFPSLKEIIVKDIDSAICCDMNDQNNFLSSCVDGIYIVKSFQNDQDAAIKKQVDKIKKMCINPLVMQYLQILSEKVDAKITCKDVCFLQKYIFFFNEQYLKNIDHKLRYYKDKDNFCTYLGMENLNNTNNKSEIYNFFRLEQSILEEYNKQFNEHIESIKCLPNTNIILSALNQIFSLFNKQSYAKELKSLQDTIDRIVRIETISTKIDQNFVTMLGDLETNLECVNKMCNLLEDKIKDHKKISADITFLYDIFFIFMDNPNALSRVQESLMRMFKDAQEKRLSTFFNNSVNNIKIGLINYAYRVQYCLENKAKKEQVPIVSAVIDNLKKTDNMLLVNFIKTKNVLHELIC